MSGGLLKSVARSLPLAFALALGTSFLPASYGQTAAPQPKAAAKAKAKAKVAAKAKAEPAAAKTPLDLNKATAEEMVEALPGVGEVTAKKIVAGRPYKSVDDLTKAGVPARTIEAIRGLVTIPAAEETKPATAATKAAMPRTKTATKTATKPAAARAGAGKSVNINTASKEELETLPDIGPVKAQAIIDTRPFKTKEDVMKVRGIKSGIFSKIKDLISVE